MHVSAPSTFRHAFVTWASPVCAVQCIHVQSVVYGLDEQTESTARKDIPGAAPSSVIKTLGLSSDDKSAQLLNSSNVQCCEARVYVFTFFRRELCVHHIVRDNVAEIHTYCNTVYPMNNSDQVMLELWHKSLKFSPYSVTRAIKTDRLQLRLVAIAQFALY